MKNIVSVATGNSFPELKVFEPTMLHQLLNTIDEDEILKQRETSELA